MSERSLRRAVAVALLLTACQNVEVPPETRALQAEPSFTASPWPEADLLFHRDPRWLGADAAFSVDLGHERVLWLFGDTFIATSARHERSESRMVRNTIAVQQGLEPSHAEIKFFWQPGPAAWLPQQSAEWFWPLHGLRVPGGPLILFWSRVRATPGKGLGFEAVGWTAVLIDNPDDAPEQWAPRVLQPAPFPAGILPAQGLFIEGDHAYALAIREPGDHAGFALRISLEALSRGELSAFEIWDGSWTPVAKNAAPVAVLGDAAPEMSLHFSAKLNRYVHVRSLGFGATTLALETSKQFTGPWSAPVTLFRPPESDRKDAFVYAGKAHPELKGADFVATYAANSMDFGTLVHDSTLYYPRFVRVDIAPR